VGSDHGAALLKNPQLAVEIVRAVKENTQLPVSVKTRLGWSGDDEILDFAPALLDAGIDAIIIHGRTYKDGFKNTARWENIYKVKEMFKDNLVVIGNGDLANNEDICNKLKNLDGIAVGRGTFGKPWIFSKDQISVAELKKLIIEHATLVENIKGEWGIVEFRKHLLAYLKGFSNAKEMRKQAVAVRSVSDVVNIVAQI